MTNETTPVTTFTPVVVVGAGGYVGSRLATGLARTGRTVLAASRARPEDPVSDGGPGRGGAPPDGSRGASPAARGRIRPVTYADVAGLGDAVRAACDRDGLPLPGGVAASIGGWHLGARLLDEPDLHGWHATLDSHLTAHLAAVRTLVPLLRDSADPHPAYVVLNGAARAEPMAGSGAINVTGAGLAMLIQVLNLEELPPGGSAARRPVRFHELVIDHAVAGDDRNVTPERLVAPARVAEAVATILGNPATTAVVHVR